METLTFFGVNSTLLLAGLAGGLWAQSYQTPTPFLQRLVAAVVASFVAAYLAPVGDILLALLLPSNSLAGTLSTPSAVFIGLTAHRVIGPAVMRATKAKMEDMTK